MPLSRISPFASMALETKTTLLSIATMVTLAITVVLTVSSQLSANAEAKASERQDLSMRVAWDALHQYGTSFRIDNNQIYAGNQRLDGFVDVVDHIKTLVGGTATIFRGDVRTTTNVLKPDGSRAVGTPLAAGPAYDAVLRDGKPYRGRTKILGVPYFAAYDPIKNDQGKTIGVLYVGVPTADFLADVSRAENIIAIVGFVVTMITALFTLLVSKAMFRPLTGIRLAMERLGSGDLSIDVPGSARHDEIGSMATVVTGFRDAARTLEITRAGLERAESEQRHVVDVLSTNLASVAGGDLTAEIREEFPTAFVALKSNFNSALANLRSLIGGVTQTAMHIQSGSGEIAQASEDLARRTETNAASLEETSAALVQMEGRLKSSAAASVSTVARADQAMSAVDSGRNTAASAMKAMNRVSTCAKGIDSVIEGVDKIAFQTRVLAMNAAVEAGRAGDAGRGFAVVADLVSALAMRAEEEAKRAREQLTVTQGEIIVAVDAVSKVDQALTTISGDVGEVNSLLSSMASDNQAQSSAISEIAAAVAMMDRATQQNAAMVEETSAAARTLSSEVSAMADEARRFKTDGMATRRASTPRLDRASAAAGIKAFTGPSLQVVH